MSESPAQSPQPENDQQSPDTDPPMNRAERRGQGKKKGPAPHGGGKVQGAKFDGSGRRQYQSRKNG